MNQAPMDVGFDISPDLGQSEDDQADDQEALDPDPLDPHGPDVPPSPHGAPSDNSDIGTSLSHLYLNDFCQIDVDLTRKRIKLTDDGILCYLIFLILFFFQG